MNGIRDKSPVRLRKRRLLNGNYSLYLDIYDSGNRIKEYLKLYLLPERTAKAKEQNKKTLELAETIRAERMLALQANKSSFFQVSRKELGIPFAKYMRGEVERMKELRTPDYIRRYTSGIKWVEKFDTQTALGKIDKKWLQGFIKFLSTTPGKYGRLLNQNTIHEYLIYVANILNIAVREGILQSSPTKMLSTVDRPKKYDAGRDYLTIEELDRMQKVPSIGKYQHIRGAFLFACFCGLRYSDIMQLKWKNIRVTEEGLVIEKKIQKTQRPIYLPLSKKASNILPERGKESDLVFSLPKSMVTVEAYIKVWSEFAGIEKHVTFHTSRHTFAVNILALGGDIYTLSKLLGHKRVATTQIYAEVLDENKKKTMQLLDKLDK